MLTLPTRIHQRGFTLLEMVLVLFLMGMMASATLLLTENIEDQAKYEDTKRRIEVIQQAIIGVPNRTLNGQPEVSGFAADMGRLPLCIAELLKVDDDGVGGFISPCDSSPIVKWTTDSITNVSYGWRGPYIQSLAEQSGTYTFRDGYNNVSATNDDQNFGWIWIAGASNNIDLKSEGYSAGASDDYSSSLVKANEWQLNTITVNFINNSPTALPTAITTLNFNTYKIADENAPYATSDDLTIPIGSIPANSNKSYTFTFNAVGAIPIPIGRHVYIVECSNGNVFEGSGTCGSSISMSTDPIAFTAVPGRTIILDWVIQ